MFTIIPELISLETNTNGIEDFLLGQTLPFFPQSKKGKFHYSITYTPTVLIPKTSKYRIGNYTLSNDTVYYHRPLFRGFGFSFSYQPSKRTFQYNYLYKLHKVNIGDILTVGRNLFHIIEADLAREGYFIILGAAVKKDKNTIILLAPNGNGKTTFVNRALLRGYSYISENYIIIQPRKNKIYGVAPIFKNKKRTSNEQLSNIFKTNNISVSPTASIQNIYLLSHHDTQNKLAIVANYTDTYTRYYKKNNLVRSLSYLQLDNTILDKQYATVRSFLQHRVNIISDISCINV